MNLSELPLVVSCGAHKNYCYLSFDIESRDAVIIDPAWEPEVIESGVRSNGLRIRAILITHGHPDHVHLAGMMSMKYNVPIYISETDLQESALPSYLNIRLIRREEPIQLGSMLIKPIFTPGHSAGGICYLIGGALFSGDTLFAEGCGMCVGDRSDPVELFWSLQRLKLLVPDRTRIFSGHRYYYDVGQTMSFALENNIYLQFDKVDHFVAFRMRKGQKAFFDFR